MEFRLMVADHKIGSLSRGLHIVGVMAHSDSSLSLSDIAAKAGLSKSSTHRLLQTLIQEGFVTQEKDTSYYRLGLKLLSLAGTFMDGINLDQLVYSILENLSSQTQQAVHLALWDSNVAVYAQKIDMPSSIRMYSQVGKRVPMHCTGLGKAILAFLPEQRARELIKRDGLPGYTSNTITDLDALLDRLTQIKQCGYALDEEEHEEGIHCIAAPLLNRQGEVMGAISLASLTFRVDRETLLSWWPLLQECTQQAATILENHL